MVIDLTRATKPQMHRQNLCQTQQISHTTNHMQTSLRLQSHLDKMLPIDVYLLQFPCSRIHPVLLFVKTSNDHNECNNNSSECKSHNSNTIRFLVTFSLLHTLPVWHVCMDSGFFLLICPAENGNRSLLFFLLPQTIEKNHQL